MLKAKASSRGSLVSGKAILLSVALWTACAQASMGLGLQEFRCLVRMRDGACLPTQVYLPRLPRGPYPVVLVRIPDSRYEISRQHARYVCHKGYGLVVQEMRNCRNVPGTTMLYVHGEVDGHDTIQWIACQPWSNRRIGTWGPSALGFAQNLLAPDAPPYLRAQHVMMAFSNMYEQAVYQGGAFRQELVEGWINRRACGEEMLAHIRLHPNYDAMWAEWNPLAKASQVNVPTVFWGGWYDPFVQGTIGSYTTIAANGGPVARAHSRLILGPWVHTDIETLVDPRKNTCSPRAGDPLRWFDYWLKCENTGVLCDKPVHYYVMGDACDPYGPGNRWKTADQWPPPHAPANFYLLPGGGLRPNEPPTDGAELSYQYDPANPVPTLGGNNLEIAAGAVDQRGVETRPDVLVFTSDPLADPVVVAGPITAKLYVASDAPDTDFTVKLTDVYPDGRSMLVADGILRARFRKSFAAPEPLKTGEVYELTIEVGSTARAFSRGHQIRVAISSSNAPRFEPNANTWPEPGEQAVPHIATNTLHLSKERPSHVILPVTAAGH